jgi:hypothetical protein
MYLHGHDLCLLQLDNRRTMYIAAQPKSDITMPNTVHTTVYIEWGVRSKHQVAIESS